MVRYLEAAGWRIEWVSNTAIKEHGDDIRATRDGRTLRVEVKGWPTVGYADPARVGEVKRTRPSTQAGHWYSQALLHVIRDVARHPDDLVAVALPDWARFRNLVDETEGPPRGPASPTPSLWTGWILESIARSHRLGAPNISAGLQG